MPDAYTTEISIYRGYWMTGLKKVGLAEVQRAQELGVSPESLFESLITDTPPGPDGLVCSLTGRRAFEYRSRSQGRTHWL